jgi:alpha,alpha-trehalose phosphorylase
LRQGEALEIAHHGETFDVTEAEPVTRSIPPRPQGDLPTQPPGRAPARRRPAG